MDTQTSEETVTVWVVFGTAKGEHINVQTRQIHVEDVWPPEEMTDTIGLVEITNRPSLFIPEVEVNCAGDETDNAFICVRGTDEVKAKAMYLQTLKQVRLLLLGIWNTEPSPEWVEEYTEVVRVRKEIS